jgi:hypothetical protein
MMWSMCRLKVDRTDTRRSGTTRIIEAIVGHRPDEDRRAGSKYHVKWEGRDSKYHLCATFLRTLMIVGFAPLRDLK